MVGAKGATEVYWALVEAKWNRYQGMIQSRWGRLTDEDLTSLEGDRDKLLARLQELYELSREEAEEELDDFLETHEAWQTPAPSYH